MAPRWWRLRFQLGSADPSFCAGKSASSARAGVFFFGEIRWRDLRTRSRPLASRERLPDPNSAPDRDKRSLGQIAKQVTTHPQRLSARGSSESRFEQNWALGPRMAGFPSDSSPKMPSLVQPGQSLMTPAPSGWRMAPLSSSNLTVSIETNPVLSTGEMPRTGSRLKRESPVASRSLRAGWRTSCGIVPGLAWKADGLPACRRARQALKCDG